MGPTGPTKKIMISNKKPQDPFCGQVHLHWPAANNMPNNYSP
jgi:hypothetical protein